jgi:hypothetical protein
VWVGRVKPPCEDDLVRELWQVARLIVPEESKEE